MKYVISDLHGCIQKYHDMLNCLNLQPGDTLYVLGDVVDRGKDGIAILLDMMNRRNVVPILGNHDLMAFTVLGYLNNDDGTFELQGSKLRSWQEWMFNGGAPTQEAFSVLPYGKRKRILEYLEEFSLYEEVSAGEKNFLLVHAGLSGFLPQKPLWEYDLHDFLWGRTDYDTIYFPDKFLVTGHTPTFHIGEEYRGKIYQKNRHIALDCGAVYGEKLGGICLDTLEEFYV